MTDEKKKRTPKTIPFIEMDKNGKITIAEFENMTAARNFAAENCKGDCDHEGWIKLKNGNGRILVINGNIFRPKGTFKYEF